MYLKCVLLQCVSHNAYTAYPFKMQITNSDTKMKNGK